MFTRKLFILSIGIAVLLTLATFTASAQSACTPQTGHITHTTCGHAAHQHTIAALPPAPHQSAAAPLVGLPASPRHHAAAALPHSL